MVWIRLLSGVDQVVVEWCGSGCCCVVWIRLLLCGVIRLLLSGVDQVVVE